MNKLNKKLGKEILIFDGAMGTLLQAEGLAGGELPELWNVNNPELITSIHQSYIDHGAVIIKTNTLGANRLKLENTGFSVDDIVSAGINCVRKVAKDDTMIALDIGPLGKLLKPYGDLAFDDAYELFAEMIKAGKDADCILIETMSDTYEAKAAILAAKENSALPVMITFTFDEDGKLLSGGSIQAAICLSESLGVDVVGVNCGLGPIEMDKFLPEFVRCASIPVCVNPNAGLPTSVNGKTLYSIGPDVFSDYAEKFANMGVSVLGGCCGTTPEHIQMVASKVKGKPVVFAEKMRKTMVSSYTKTVTIGDKPVLIGERINPTGKPLLKQALLEKDFEFICREGIVQAEHDADILDVNVGLPQIDEVYTLEQAIMALQGVTDTPLQIDTSNVQAMERALRIYNGRPIVNSVNGKEESLNTVLPLVQKYGACVVALTLDEQGIPETAQGRIEIAKRILKTAKEYGIPKEDILFDTLAMTVSTGSHNAIVALDALDYIRNTLKVNTILGVSNISFGLPQRDYISSTFFALAMQRGLSAGIINPLSAEMMKVYRAYGALMGYDAGCSKYINAYANANSTSTAPNGHNNMTLYKAITRGLKEQAGHLTHQLLPATKPLDIINNHIIPALDEVGKGFEAKTIFLPQLLVSAEAAKASFDVLKQFMIKEGIVQEKKGKIILATVKGDVHDIGKNIVKVLLQNYGYDVIDLGKDVEPQLVVDTVIENNVKLVGLSALMTTTVANMETTIKRLKKSAQCKIMVGGAVLNQEYAKEIGADFYSPDAMGSVRYADEVFKVFI